MNNVNEGFKVFLIYLLANSLLKYGNQFYLNFEINCLNSIIENIRIPKYKEAMKCSNKINIWQEFKELVKFKGGRLKIWILFYLIGNNIQTGAKFLK